MGGWSQIFTRPFPARRTAFKALFLGTGNHVLQNMVACPQEQCFERSSPCWKWAGEDLTPPAHDRIEMGSFPVISFVCAFVPGTPRWHAPAASTALLKRHPAFGLRRRQLGPGFAWSYWRHSHQSGLLNHRVTNPAPDYHSGRHTPCPVIQTLHYSSHVGRTT